MAISQVGIRKSAIEAVSALPTTQSVNDLLVHADWVANFIQTGALPEVSDSVLDALATAR